MKRLTLIAALSFAALPAMAQYTTAPTVYGQPQWGYTTTGPGGPYHTAPTVYGQPQWGYTTTGPSGSCRTTSTVYGQPQWGTTTNCQ